MPSNRELGNKAFDLSIILTQGMKQRFKGATVDQLKEALGGYMHRMEKPITEVKEGDDPATIEISEDILVQLCTLACPSLARLLATKYRCTKG